MRCSMREPIFSVRARRSTAALLCPAPSAMGNGQRRGVWSSAARVRFSGMKRRCAGTDAGNPAAGRSRPAAATRTPIRAVLERLPWRTARRRSIPAGARRRSQLARAVVRANAARHRGTGGTERYRRLAARKGRDRRLAKNIDSVDKERRTTDLIEESRHNRVSSLVKSYAAARRQISPLFRRRMSGGEWYVFRSYLAANLAS